jgi:sterol 3beta-glucosyltransferase
MASQDRGRDRGSRRLAKKRKDAGTAVRGLSLDIPERFKDGDDAHEDVTAPKRNDTISMNQSLFSMIARAGQQSQVDLGTMQEVDSGDSDDDDSKRKSPYHGLDGAARLSRLSTANDFQAPPEDAPTEKAAQPKHRRVLSDNKLLRSLPKLKMSSRKEPRSNSKNVDPMSSSQFLPPPPTLGSSKEISASEQSPKGKARAIPGEDVHVEKLRGANRRSGQASTASLAKSKGPVTLATRIQQIFEFEEAEEVISEYPCWLLQSILLQGYMYVTQKHICFYAYIPKKHVRIFLYPTTPRTFDAECDAECTLTFIARRQQNRLLVQARTLKAQSILVHFTWRRPFILHESCRALLSTKPHQPAICRLG